MFPGLGAIIGVTVAIIMFVVVALLLALVAVVYVGLRVQDARQASPDPKLGLKVAFHAVHTTAVLIALAGCSLFMIDAMEGVIAPVNRPVFGGPAGQAGGLSAERRTSFALVGSGALFGMIFWAFLLGTNDGEQRSVRRVFGGGRMALCLLITMFTVTALVVNLAQKTADDRVTESLLGMLVVWFPAGVVHMFLFFTNVNRKTKSRRADDDDDDKPWTPPGR